MQRQKILAKWLAVALLLTVAIACYIAFSAILGKEKPSDTTASATQNDPKPQDVPQDEPIHQPIYSLFPRHAEQVGNAMVSHLGGEKDEKFLCSYFLNGKTYMFFASDSDEYDVKGKGIYLATLANDYLLDTTKITDDKEEYLSSILTRGGILILTRTNTQTVLRLFGASGETMSNTFNARFESCLLTLDSTTKDAILFAADSRLVYSYTINSNLTLSRSNFVYSTRDCTLKYMLDFSSLQILFVENSSGLDVLVYNKNNGFTRKNLYVNCSFVQILPNSSNMNFAFVLLMQKTTDQQKSMLLASFDQAANQLASYLLNDVESAVAKQENDLALLITKNNVYSFCSHLELVASSRYDFDDSLFVGDITLKDIEGTTLFLRTDGITFEIVNTSLQTLFFAKGKNLNFEYRNLGSTQNSNMSRVRLVYEAKNNDALSYMTFGGFDVMVLDTII